MMKIRYLSYNEVLDAYRQQINKYGGYCAVRDNDILLSAIANSQRVFAGTDLYPSLSAKAAIFVYSLNKGQPFVEGNKRTAYICGRLFLRMNGHDAASLESYYRLIVNMAKGNANKDDVADWFTINIVKINAVSNVIGGKEQ